MKIFRVGCLYIWHPVSSQWFILGMNDIPDDEIDRLVGLDYPGRREALDRFTRGTDISHHIMNRIGFTYLTTPAGCFPWNILKLFISVYLREYPSIDISQPCKGALPCIYYCSAIRGDGDSVTLAYYVHYIRSRVDHNKWDWYISSFLARPRVLGFRYFFGLLNSLARRGFPEDMTTVCEFQNDWILSFGVSLNEFVDSFNMDFADLEDRVPHVVTIPFRIRIRHWKRTIRDVFAVNDDLYDFAIKRGPIYRNIEYDEDDLRYNEYYYVKVRRGSNGPFVYFCVGFRGDRQHLNGQTMLDIFPDNTMIFETIQ